MSILREESWVLKLRLQTFTNTCCNYVHASCRTLKKQHISNGHVLSLYLVLKIAETRTMWISLCFCMGVLWSRSEEMFEIVLSTVLLLWTSSSNTAPTDLCESRPYKWVCGCHHHTANTLSVVLENTGKLDMHQYYSRFWPGSWKKHFLSKYGPS